MPPRALMSSSSSAETIPSFASDSIRFEVNEGGAFPDFYKSTCRIFPLAKGIQSIYHFLFDHVEGNIELRANVNPHGTSISLELSTRKPRRNMLYCKLVNTSHWKIHPKTDKWGRSPLVLHQFLQFRQFELALSQHVERRRRQKK